MQQKPPKGERAATFFNFLLPLREASQLCGVVPLAHSFPPPPPPLRIFLAIDVFPARRLCLLCFFFVHLVFLWSRLLSSLSLLAWFVTQSQRENKPVPVYYTRTRTRTPSVSGPRKTGMSAFFLLPLWAEWGNAQGVAEGAGCIAFILALVFSCNSFTHTRSLHPHRKKKYYHQILNLFQKILKFKMIKY